MADTIEQRLSDVEHMLAHMPEDLDARFAGVDVKLAELRELILLQNSRFTKIEARLTELARNAATHASDLNSKLDAHISAFDEHASSVDRQLAEILKRLRPAP
jgi:predicted nucleotidyltransferase